MTKQAHTLTPKIGAGSTPSSKRFLPIYKQVKTIDGAVDTD
jgi:hypothetical protein